MTAVALGVGVDPRRRRPPLRRRSSPGATRSPTRCTSATRRPSSWRARRAAMAKVARAEPRRVVPSGRGTARAAVGDPHHPRAQPARPGRGGHRRRRSSTSPSGTPRSRSGRAWTGRPVFLAHDVSYFVHLNALKPGDAITYATACNTVDVSGQCASRSCPPGQRWPTRPRPESGARHVLAAQRVVLHAGPPADPRQRGRGGDQGRAPRTRVPGFIDTVQSTDYTTSAPPALQAQGLTLEQNEAPMGTMNLVNASVAFAQSPGPALARGRRPRDLLRRPPRGGPAQRQFLVARHRPRRGHAAPSSTGRRSPTTTPPSTSRSTRPAGSRRRSSCTTTVTLTGGAEPGQHADDGRSPCSRQRGDHRELGLQLIQGPDPSCAALGKVGAPQGWHRGAVSRVRTREGAVDGGGRFSELRPDVRRDAPRRVRLWWPRSCGFRQRRARSGAAGRPPAGHVPVRTDPLRLPPERDARP